MRIIRMLFGLSALALVTACSSNPESPRSRTFTHMTDAEVEAHNASARPMDQIFCRQEMPTGSRIMTRVCQTIGEAIASRNAQLDLINNSIE